MNIFTLVNATIVSSIWLVSDEFQYLLFDCSLHLLAIISKKAKNPGNFSSFPNPPSTNVMVQRVLQDSKHLGWIDASGVMSMGRPDEQILP